mgnify:CR=1 FL=1|jgi:hypothetical protein
MTKQEYIDFVHEELGEALRKNIEKQSVEAAINTAYNQIVFDLVRGGVRNFDLCRKRFTSIAVTYDSNADVYYSDWPAAIVPHINGEMIVSTVQGSGIRFAPMSEQDVLLTTGLLVDLIDTTIYTIIKRERIEYYNMESLSQDEIDTGSSPTPKISTVRMDLAIEFREFATTDEVYMPMGRDYEVLELALDFLRKEPIIDIRNN